jgi:hypothetical protein
MTVLMEKAKVLKENIAYLPASKKDFANSLLTQLAHKGSLSDKQWYWVDKLADMAQGIPDFTMGMAEKHEVGLLTGLAQMFEKAGVKLKHPAINLNLDDGREVRLSRAGDNSANPGFIYVKIGKYNYVGKVSPNGEFFPAKAVDSDTKRDVVEFLRDLSRHPAEVAAKYGKLTGRCCFCGLPLSDPKSTAVGYGKQCASHYGLPWGAINCTEA